uniref:G protein signaling modulator 1 n=1 Tax=Capra hircus TaxID=9925 RepID=A0A452DK07_CAPHI
WLGPCAPVDPTPDPSSLPRMEASCLELALEGERLCKAGDFKAGVAFFEAAVQVGTEDLKTLSAIYSQLGNAYFYLKEYARALEYHKHDLLLARTIGDRMGEAKASGNLGNTLKVLGRFDEAVVCCQRHLDIAQEQGDKVGEARALYNIGNVYHAKGKQLSWSAAQDPGHLPPAVRETLPPTPASSGLDGWQGVAGGDMAHMHSASRRNLSLVKELGDRAAQGRAYGNLGNTHYLLGSFTEATTFHKETLQLSRQLKDQAVEAQACYSLGNTYTLLQDYERAAEYHLRHLLIAQELADRLGEGRACWSLGNAYVSMGSPAQALTFAKKHLEISQEVGDRSGELTARMNVAQLQLALGRLASPAAAEKPDLAGYEAQGARPKRTQRLSAETWDLLRLPLEREQNGDSHHSGDWRGPGRDLLPLPVRSRKYQEGPDSAERRPREGGHSPLDSADVRVQLPRTVGDPSPGADGAPGRAPLPTLTHPDHRQPRRGLQDSLGCRSGPRAQSAAPSWGHSMQRWMDRGRVDRWTGTDGGAGGGAGSLLPGRRPAVPGRLVGLSRPSGSGQGAGGTEGHMPRSVRVQRSAWSPPPTQNP